MELFGCGQFFFVLSEHPGSMRFAEHTVRLQKREERSENVLWIRNLENRRIKQKKKRRKVCITSL